MKKIFLSLLVLSIVLFELSLLISGSYIAIALPNHSFEAVVLIALGLILSICSTLTVFVFSVTTQSTKLNLSLVKLLSEIKTPLPPKGDNPFSIFDAILKNYPGAESSIQVLGTDEEGNIKPIAGHNFKPGEDKDEILAKMLNIAFNKGKTATKAIEEMGLEELKAELKKALSEEKFEKAALLRNKINELENK